MIFVIDPAPIPIVRYRRSPTDKRLPETNSEAKKRDQTGEQRHYRHGGSQPLRPELSGVEHV
jgi:hypothetical protein